MKRGRQVVHVQAAGRNLGVRWEGNRNVSQSMCRRDGVKMITFFDWLKGKRTGCAECETQTKAIYAANASI